MSASIELEKLGIPAVILATEPFNDACKGMARMGGMPNLRWPLLPHPIGSLSDEELKGRARLAVEQLVPIFTREPSE